jgi:hypothetical protein
MSTKPLPPLQLRDAGVEEGTASVVAAPTIGWCGIGCCRKRQFWPRQDRWPGQGGALDFSGRASRLSGMLIKPISVRLLAYGMKPNVAAILTRARDLITEEHGTVDPAAITTLTAKKAFELITAMKWDAEVALKKPAPSHVGIEIALTQVNERLTVEWLHELPLAKTCIALASWDSPREGTSWQLICSDGGRWSESRPLAP